MRARRSGALIVLLIGMGWAAASGSSQAESTAPSPDAEVRQICAEHGGRFEQFWRYNDQGTQWGHVMSCSTDAGFVTCQDSVCRSGQWVRPGSGNVASEPGGDGDSVHFPTDPDAIARALVALAER